MCVCLCVGGKGRPVSCMECLTHTTHQCVASGNDCIHTVQQCWLQTRLLKSALYRAPFSTQSSFHKYKTAAVFVLKRRCEAGWLAPLLFLPSSLSVITVPPTLPVLPSVTLSLFLSHLIDLSPSVSRIFHKSPPPPLSSRSVLPCFPSGRSCTLQLSFHRYSVS